MNEVDRVEQMVRANTSPRGGRWKRLSRRFESHLQRTPTMRGVYYGAVFFAVGIALTFVQFQHNAAHDRRVDQRAAAQDVYLAKVIAYSQAVNAYQICLDGVARSDQNRAQWNQLADIIAALDTGSGHAVTFADEIRNGPLLSTPPRVIADCANPGPYPTPPD